MHDVMWRDTESDLDLHEQDRINLDFWRSLGLENATPAEKRRALASRALGCEGD